MKITVEKRCSNEIEIKYLVVTIPDDEAEHDDAYTGDGRAPKINGKYEYTVDVDTGIIQDWPTGLEVDAYFKPRDSGEYRLIDASGSVVVEVYDYVPALLDHNDGGDDYLDFRVDGTGKWTGLRILPGEVATLIEEWRQ